MDQRLHLILQAKQGDKEARDVLIQENLGLVRHIVKRFAGRGCDMEDLFQIGTIGLIKAIDKFDMDYGVQFSTYAVPLIMGEIKRFLRDDGLVKVSRSLKENGYRIRQAEEKISHREGRGATLEELAEATSLTREEIVLALEANSEVESIYKPVYQSDGSQIYLVDQIADKENEKEKLLNHMMLTKLLEELDEKEREIITLRYFQDKTQTEVAKKLGVSQVQISRLEKKILIHMRQALTV
ncbi:MAG: RNA polymerase sporulation sigma factor SigF [Roseburia sp.]|nr:RNA polymerase sporulation sigma factor SigF [Roseburia sp.]MCM1278885.1 RNA polymerase sporulation sigma factor SigF [Robinsoniella sp.]